MLLVSSIVHSPSSPSVWSHKSDSSYNDVKVELKGVHSHSQYEDVQLEPNPAYGVVPLSNAPTEPQPYEEPVVGVTSDDVTMEENPAYQPVVDTVTAFQTVEPIYL